MLVRLLPPPLLLLALLPPSQHVAAAAVAGGSRCGTALSVACAEARADVFRCAQCAGSHAGALQAAGCSNDSIALWCAGQQPLDTPLTLRLATDAATATAFPPGRRYTPAGFWAASPVLPLAKGPVRPAADFVASGEAAMLAWTPPAGVARVDPLCDSHSLVRLLGGATSARGSGSSGKHGAPDGDVVLRAPSGELVTQWPLLWSRLDPWVNSSGTKNAFLRTTWYLKRSIYRDRLRTNIGKAEDKGRFVQAFATRSLSLTTCRGRFATLASAALPAAIAAATPRTG